MNSATEDTAEMPSAQAFAELFFAPSQKPVRITFGAATHIGHVRKTNEDQYAVVRRTRMRDVLLSSLPESSFPPSVEAAFVVAVADGVGGGAFGEIASRLVLESVWELAGRATSWVMKFTDLDALQLRERVNAYVDRIEERLKELGRDDPELAGMATTCTCAHIMGRDVVVSNIGDSRAYLWRGGDCRLLTHDHTLGELLKSAGLPDEDYERLRNVLVNCLSSNPKTKAFPEIEHFQLEDGDRLLLCTDGLSNMLTDEGIADVLGRFWEPQSACHELVRQALEAGGRDNITVVLAAFDS